MAGGRRAVAAQRPTVQVDDLGEQVWPGGQVRLVAGDHGGPLGRGGGGGQRVGVAPARRPADAPEPAGAGQVAEPVRPDGAAGG